MGLVCGLPHTPRALLCALQVEKLMEIERYSHVMHISSTVTGQLLPQLDCWDALRAALPAGTVSGAPKVSCMLPAGLRACRAMPQAGVAWIDNLALQAHLLTVQCWS
jgi:hypothetical protein